MCIIYYEKEFIIIKNFLSDEERMKLASMKAVTSWSEPAYRQAVYGLEYYDVMKSIYERF
jgi:hypothetical protein